MLFLKVRNLKYYFFGYHIFSFLRLILDSFRVTGLPGLSGVRLDALLPAISFSLLILMFSTTSTEAEAIMAMPDSLLPRLIRTSLSESSPSE